MMFVLPAVTSTEIPKVNLRTSNQRKITHGVFVSVIALAWEWLPFASRSHGQCLSYSCYDEVKTQQAGSVFLPGSNHHESPAKFWRNIMVSVQQKNKSGCEL
jgi:hypothetical protein